MIIVLIGASATGKTSIVSLLLQELPGSYMLPSWTTRQPRSSDIPGEYVYVTLEEFERKRATGAFEWDPEFDRFQYGTLKSDIVEALRGDACCIAILLPYAVPQLCERARACGRGAGVHLYHLLPPPFDVLRERMRRRGDSEASIDRRIGAAAKQEAEVAGLAGLPIIPIPDSAAIGEKCAAILDHIRLR